MQKEIGEPGQAQANKRQQHHGNCNVDNIANRIHGYRLKRYGLNGLIRIFPLFMFPGHQDS